MSIVIHDPQKSKNDRDIYFQSHPGFSHEEAARLVANPRYKFDKYEPSDYDTLHVKRYERDQVQEVKHDLPSDMSRASSVCDGQTTTLTTSGKMPPKSRSNETS